MDIKPGSYPNSINVDNNGVVTIAIQKETYPPNSVDLYLEQKVGGSYVQLNSYTGVVPERYEYISNFVLCPFPGTICYTRNVYVVKFKTQELSKLFEGYLDEEDLYLRIQYPGFESRDSIRLLSNNK